MKVVEKVAISYYKLVKKTILGGTVHKVPSDLASVLYEDQRALSTWEDITPLARNEWICLVISAKQDETRNRRLERTRNQLRDGKRRPCCWAGCIHRAKDGHN